VIADVVLDHVAVATERQKQAWPRYAGDLAGRWLGGGWTLGFASAQVEYANGMKVEVLEPYEQEHNDFLRRFLDRNGPGPHHLTFKVKDIGAALEQAEAAGYSPVGVELRDPRWKEAFLHPKQACGVVIQLAQSAGDWEGPRRRGLPAPRTAEPASLDHVAHAVPALDDGRRLFVDLLAGDEVDAGDGWVELAWRGGGRVRLLERPAGVDLDSLPGRVSHLAFTCEAPEEIPEAVAAGDGTFVVAAEQNLGTRLVLHPQG
jgi:methylmalonyl-CoA/ethylmalonyl-CoA epimerase